MKFLRNLVLVAVLAFGALVVYVAIFDPGVVSVEYRESKSREHDAWRKLFVANQSFAPVAEAIDAHFDLPRDLRIITQDCGEPNAFYDPQETAITICYELVTALARDYQRYVRSDSLLAVAVWQTTLFVVYHEVGHALVDMHQLPVTGREEDAVDQLATLVLLSAGDDGRDAALRGAEWFGFTGERRRGRFQFWGEHSLDQQRYFNVLCWVYGSSPDAHGALLSKDWGLPRERAERCPSEYARMSTAWNRLLGA